MSRSKSRLIRAGLAAGAATAMLLAATATPALAAPNALVLSSPSGPSEGGNTITATATVTANDPAPFTAGVTPYVQFQWFGASAAATCSLTYKAAAAITANATSPYALTGGVVITAAADVKKLSTTKLAITIPSDDAASGQNNDGLKLAANQTSAKYNLCVYSGTVATTSPLIAKGTYTIAVPPTITEFTPEGGPSLGGNDITVTGTGFTPGAGAVAGTTATNATLGGRALTNIRVATNGLSFVGTLPSNPSTADQTLVVTAAGGRVSSDDPDNNPATNNPLYYNYSFGLSISPNTAPEGGEVDLDIMGAGFLELNWGSAASAAHVYLVRDAPYTQTAPNSDIECEDVLPIMDTELICTLDTTGEDLGAYTVTVVASGSTLANQAAEDAVAPNGYVESDITSGATFTIAPY
ncbi:IPT/TIG domain-containing protein [Actinoplanes sp. NPDC051346]|uniref:IPT/TIG domain-containing protein n=1 Tax=Actinoplanes sp. NPDC051346 TaxID=3155048 RepID=UPI0034289583